MSNEIVQITFDYSLLTEEQANKLQAIYNRVVTRHVATVYEDGKDLLEARDIKGLPYKDFIAWAQACYGWSEGSVKNKINVALNWGITPPGGVIEDHAMYLLSTKNTPESARQEAKQLLASGVDVDEEKAKELRDAHKAREEAEKKAATAQQQVTLFTLLVQEKQEKVDELSQQIAELEEKLKNATKPETKEVIPQKTLDKIANLEALNKKQKERNNMLSDHIDKLHTEIQNQRDANEARRKQEAYVAEIKQDWKKATDALFKALSEFHGKIPSPIATQVFEGEEWARYDKIDQALTQFQSAFLAIRTTRYGDQFIDANTDSLAVYGG